MNSINTINGVLVAAQSDFANHAEDKTLHLREEEREAWNAKADASSLSGKVDTDTFRSHETNTTVHVSPEEKEKWNARNTKGAVVATQDGLDEHVENTTVHITEEERTAWNGAVAIPGASNAFTGDNTHTGTETFNGPLVCNSGMSLLGEDMARQIFLSQLDLTYSLRTAATWCTAAQGNQRGDGYNSIYGCTNKISDYGGGRLKGTLTRTDETWAGYWMYQGQGNNYAAGEETAVIMSVNRQCWQLSKGAITKVAYGCGHSREDLNVDYETLFSPDLVVSPMRPMVLLSMTEDVKVRIDVYWAQRHLQRVLTEYDATNYLQVVVLYSQREFAVYYRASYPYMSDWKCLCRFGLGSSQQFGRLIVWGGEPSGVTPYDCFAITHMTTPLGRLLRQGYGDSLSPELEF